MAEKGDSLRLSLREATHAGWTKFKQAYEFALEAASNGKHSAFSDSVLIAKLLTAGGPILLDLYNALNLQNKPTMRGNRLRQVCFTNLFLKRLIGISLLK